MKKGISIDVGTDLIKIISYKKTKKELTVLNAVTLSMPDCNMNDGYIGNVDVLADAIRETLVENKIKGKSVEFTVLSNKIITREVSFPDLPVKELRPLVKLNSEEYFPVDLAQYTMDFTILEHYEKDMEKFVRTNTVVIPTEIVESYVELAKKLKLNLESISYAENAMMNYALLIGDKRTYMMVDFGSGMTSVAIVKGGKIVLNRTLGNGVRGIIETIMDTYKVDYDRAIEISAENELIGGGRGFQDGFTKRIFSIVNLVVSGIERLLDYYSSKDSNGVEVIYLTGIGGNISGIAEHIYEYFNIETIALEDLSAIKSTNFKYLSNRNVFANAIGGVFSKVNLLPDDYFKKVEQRQQINIGLKLLGGLVLVGAIILYFPISANINLSKEETKQEQELVAYEESKKLIDERDVLKQKNDFLKQLEGGYSNDYTIVDVLEQMEIVVPSDIQYKSMSIDNTGILINCSAKDKNNVVNYLIRLKSMEVNGKKIFSDVFIPDIKSSPKAKAKAKKDEDGKENTEPTDEQLAEHSLDGRYEFSARCNFAKEVQSE